MRGGPLYERPAESPLRSDHRPVDHARDRRRVRSSGVVPVRPPLYRCQTIRNRYLKEGRICQLCGSDVGLQLHHKISVAIAPHLAEKKSNLMWICYSCHRNIHHRQGTGAENHCGRSRSGKVSSGSSSTSLTKSRTSTTTKVQNKGGCSTD